MNNTPQFLLNFDDIEKAVSAGQNKVNVVQETPEFLTNIGDIEKVISSAAEKDPVIYRDQFDKIPQSELPYKVIEAEGALMAAIVNQAISDSQPESIVFEGKTPMSMFNSLAFEYSDSYLFMTSSERVDFYLNLIGIDVLYVRNKWLKSYKEWKNEKSQKIALNIIEYMTDMSLNKKISKTLRVDLIAFIKSVHTDYWTKLAGIDTQEFKETLLKNMEYIPALLSSPENNLAAA